MWKKEKEYATPKIASALAPHSGRPPWRSLIPILTLLLLKTQAQVQIQSAFYLDSAVIPSASGYIDFCISKIQQNGLLKSFSLQKNVVEEGSCSQEQGSAPIAAGILNDYYTNGKKYNVLFGPMCDTEIDIMARSSVGMNMIQMDFWRDVRAPPDETFVINVSPDSAENTGLNAIAMMQMLDWFKIGVVSCSLCYGSFSSKFGHYENLHPFVAELKRTLVDNGADIQYENDITPEFLHTPTMALNVEQLTTKSRILFPILGNDLANYMDFMKAFNEMTLAREEFAVIIVLQTDPVSLPWMVNGNVNTTIFGWFEQALIIVNDYNQKELEQAFSTEAGLSGDQQSINVQLRFYEAIYTYSALLDKGLKEKGPNSYANASVTGDLLDDFNITGPFGPIVFNSKGTRLRPFKVYMVANETDNPTKPRMTEIMTIQLLHACATNEDNVDGSVVVTDDMDCFKLDVDLLEERRYLLNLLPPDMPSCGFDGKDCDQRGTILILIAIMTAICCAFMGFLCVRRMKTGETARMPWAVQSSSITFLDIPYTRQSVSKFEDLEIHSVSSARGENGNPFEDEQTINAGRERHVGSVGQAFVIVEGYKLKEKIMFDKRDMHMLFQMKQIMHDNVNTFIGLSMDRPSDFYVVWKHCLRGTVTDIIANSNAGHLPKFDRDFQSAFVRDIIRGLDYIHSSVIGYHGGLTAEQCLIDSHWILKISGFGLPRMLHRWRNTGMLAGRNGAPMIPNSELHYYSPEARRAIKLAVQKNKPEDLEYPVKEGQSHDIYAFACILHEILYNRKIVDLEDEVDTIADADDELGIFNEAAEAKLPDCPTFPSDVDIHPDLVNLMKKCFNNKGEQRPDANMCRKITDATLKTPGSLVDQMMKNTENYTNNLENLVSERTGQLQIEQQRSDEILQELLPRSVITELKLGKSVAPKLYKAATIMYSDIVGFTSLCSQSQPMEVVNLLNGMFTAFDNVIGQHKCYKVETIGDAYMVASGVPEKLRNEHVREIAYTAIKQRQFLFGYEIPHRPGQHLHCRWGFNSGSVFTGVVGVTAPRYCVFGGTVTLAAKMENSGQQDKIQMTLKSQQLLTERYPEFRTTPRGGVKLDGVGTLLTYWLDGYDEDLISGRVEVDHHDDDDVVTDAIPEDARATDIEH
ncbi:unnamed protein product [Bursaphelenchus okinawaensis]|uniref:guanylate cyclase n=1 Tax=Bursaphelenchus okinawaensis TaxID=465554 RepID=A0A811LKE8_9BILA|nr:unnamed protein product [Bursaphelenchus okinawaensis]CAG9124706.1 unnamed protein product [Bursaphelenchus okinawaensis]